MGGDTRPMQNAPGKLGGVCVGIAGLLLPCFGGPPFDKRVRVHPLAFRG